MTIALYVESKLRLDIWFGVLGPRWLYETGEFHLASEQKDSNLCLINRETEARNA